MSIIFVSAFDILDKRAPGTPEQFRELHEAVFSIRHRVKQHMDTGIQPREIIPVRGLLRAAEVAEDVVGNIVGQLAA
ncbi:hypothetical protein FACS1894116_05880 [Betaproteobacteria bacterium]|nr:hypothetical protein AGMMS49543_06320 [Betaproteobacteria bacterium]GHT93578.1 hypothetical protein FACS1894116_05880 [Betaproteobacteria bacterium]GHT98307.1 hypothetical protein FACS1894154_03390 [Betaproteobacteria bacterium]GHU00975.1 hypothetical protein AGMMS49960_10290 [Betaproteobacteria bacterium]GHU09662.1 hypothetical protein AGMMS50225_11060 [Betaproteobacteria bacterium]